MIRRIARALTILWALWLGAAGFAVAGAQVCGADLTFAEEPSKPLQRFAEGAGLRYPEVFARLVLYLDAKGTLPACYLNKDRARRAGWSPGANLWEHAPGTAIGGDYFGNHERRLPAQFNGQYLEADLDYAGGRRGGNRLIFVRNRPDSGLIWVTTDHYRSFQKVPLR